MKKSRFFLLFLLILLLVPLGAGAAILDELPLEKGATGQSVVMLQQRLIDLGYLHFRPTGSYGDMTKSAVASFHGGQPRDSESHRPGRAGQAGTGRACKLAGGKRCVYGGPDGDCDGL